MNKNNLLRKITNKKSGFILLDSIVAVVIVAIGLVAVLQLYTQGTKYRHSADMHQKAVQIAAENIEQLKVVEADSMTMRITRNAAIDALIKKSKDLNGTSDSSTNANGKILALGEAGGEKFYTKVTLSDETLDEITSSVKCKGDNSILVVTSTVYWNLNGSDPTDKESEPTTNKEKNEYTEICTYLTLPQETM